MNPWKPIETAPKDGTPILVGYWEPNKRWNCETKTHDDLPPIWAATVAFWADYPRDSNEWHLVEAGSYAEDYRVPFDPTHWTEIPIPPQQPQ